MDQALSAISSLHQDLHHELLGQDKTEYLIRMAQKGNKEAIEDLIKFNERLIFRTAEYYFRSGICGDCELVDLQQYGRMGVMKAIQKFDLQSGNKFSTYATYWIKAYIRRYGMARGSRVSMSYESNERNRQVKAAFWSLCAKLQRDPTDAEIAKKVGICEKTVRLYRNVSVISLDGSLGNHLDAGNMEHNSPYEEFLADKNAQTAETAETAALFYQAKRAMDRLPTVWRTIITYRYGLNEHERKTARELARMLNLSYQRVQQIEIQALDRLRQMMKAEPT